jgi:hypothetical protein
MGKTLPPFRHLGAQHDQVFLRCHGLEPFVDHLRMLVNGDVCFCQMYSRIAVVRGVSRSALRDGDRVLADWIISSA